MPIHKFENNFIDVLKCIYNEKYNFTEELNFFHKVLETDLITIREKNLISKIPELGKDRTLVFYKDYHNFIDNNILFNTLYYKFIEDYIKPLYDNSKIVFQKTPNLRISFPNLTALGKHNYEYETDNIIGLHKDADFGHHETEMNFIIPITDMFETNSIFYEPYSESNLSTDNYINLKLNTDEFFTERLNKLLHFNKINRTDVTRISLDFRVIKYDDYMKNIIFLKIQNLNWVNIMLQYKYFL